MIAAAFFDIDGTIYREGLITEVFKKMINYEYIEGSQWYSEVRPAYMNWDKRMGDYDTYLLKMVDIYKEAVKGLNAEQMAYVARRVIEQKGDRVYTFSREQIKWHQKEKNKVIAISGSPSELVKEMSKKYGMDDYKGTIYELDDKGYYNGSIVPMWDAVSKRKAILDMAQKYNIDLSKSYAYGDTTGDLTMLSMVGNPYAINPTRELLAKINQDESLRSKINIIVERKDVIYQLDINNLKLID